MAENEMKNEEVDNDDVPTTEPVGEEVNLDDITYEQALAWKKEAEELKAAKAKAEAKIVELKKSGKSPSETPSPTEAYTKEDALIDKFVARNPSLEGYESDLRGYLSKGVSLDEARILVENKDKSIKAKKEAEAASILHSEGVRSRQEFTRDMLAAMNQAEYNHAMGLVEQGKAILKK